MKKLLSVIMILSMAFSALMLCGCNKKNSDAGGYKDNYGFEAHVDEDAEIIGAWREKLPEDSKSDKTIWRFEASTTLNIIESVSGYSLTTGAAYNFNKETNELTYMILNSKKEYNVTVSFEGDTMSFIDEDGEIIKIFTR